MPVGGRRAADRVAAALGVEQQGHRVADRLVGSLSGPLHLHLDRRGVSRCAVAGRFLVRWVLDWQGRRPARGGEHEPQRHQDSADRPGEAPPCAPKRLVITVIYSWNATDP